MGILANYAAYLEDNGIKQSHVVDKTGMAQSKVSKLLNKPESCCDVEDYIKLCMAVKKTPNYFCDIADKIKMGIELEDWEKKVLEQQNH